MGMEIPDRVHVVPLGYEHDRVVMAASEYRADKVVLVKHTDDSTDSTHISEVVNSLDNINIEYELESCDIFDLYDSIGTIGSIISDYGSDEVYINISAGSKITAVAGFIAGTVTETAVYYGKAEKYEDTPTGFEDAFQLPHYPIDAPDKQQIITLTILHELDKRGTHPTKGDLIHVAMQNHLKFTQRDIDEKGLYRLLGTQILEPLSSYGYVESYKDGRSKRVKLTKQGEGAYEAFKSLIDPEQVELGSVGEKAEKEGQ